jgi:hypothetical protein
VSGMQASVPCKQIFISDEQVRVSGEQVRMCHARRNVYLVSRYPKSL